MKDREREILRKIILEFLTKKRVHYSELEKKVCATFHSFATTSTFRSQYQYLLTNNYIERIARGIYQISPKGKKLLELLTA